MGIGPIILLGLAIGGIAVLVKIHIQDKHLDKLETDKRKA